jgi:hypothetical protein
MNLWILNLSNIYINIFYIITLMNAIPDDINATNKQCMLDPLSVIIKLAIISNKPIGTKMMIDNNVIYLQEPGPFQSICRYILKNNKTHISYLYNPIELACQHYLSEEVIQQYPRMPELFKIAQLGLLKLIDTYKHCSIVRICLYHFTGIITNYLEGHRVPTLFIKDDMSIFYTNDTLVKLTKIWATDKIKIVLSIATFLSSDNSAQLNVRSLETIMNGIDTEVSSILQ